MLPSKLYQQDVESHKIEADPAQLGVVKVLDNLWEALEHPAKPRWPFGKKTTPKGVYIYGPVGRGKTYLMDLFYEALRVPKLRLHFYEFMADVHVQLKMLQGQVNPLAKVVQKIAQKALVLCLDEFFVEDIADAMILASLLDGLIGAGVVVVTTSNVIPKNLYKEGLQRDRFLPAIALIESKMTVVDLEHPTDYRLIAHFAASHSKTGILTDFTFAELCEEARSSLDYLALTHHCQGIFLHAIPDLQGKDDAVRRFITLVDIFYDRELPVILESTVLLGELYQGKRLAFEFGRTQSRLIEMARWV